MSVNQLPASDPPKPNSLQVITILMLINGILNIIGWLGASVAILFSFITGAIATFGIGLCCFPVLIIPLLPIALGICEIIFAARLLSSGRPRVSFNALQTIAILEICTLLFVNVLSVVVGILNLVFLNEAEVKNYLSQN